MTTSNASDFLAFSNRRYTDFRPPKGAEHLSARIRSLTAREREEYEAEMLGTDGMNVDRAKAAKRELIRITFVDDQDNLMFTHQQVYQLQGTDSALVQSMYEQARAHVGIRASDIDSLVGNSEAGRDSASPTASA